MLSLQSFKEKMSLQSALTFIREVRRSDGLRRRLQDKNKRPDISRIVSIGSEAGYDFTEEDLRAAFRHDWVMRWLQQQHKRDGE